MVRYKPVLRPHEERKGDVTLVLVPADKKAAGRDKLLIFDPKPAASRRNGKCRGVRRWWRLFRAGGDECKEGGGVPR